MFHYLPYLSDCIEGDFRARRPPVTVFSPERFEPFHRVFRDATWVHVQREDVFAQVISMYFAEFTNRWERWRDSSVVSASAVGHPPYDRAILIGNARHYIQERSQWPEFFKHFAISPFRITYEEAAENYPEYLLPLIASVDATPIEPTPTRRMLKVGDEKYAEYARRLREDWIAEFGSAP
jgi:LPS sulfotransferase NodH